MRRRRSETIVPRKFPIQARSAELVAAILQGAIRVLERDGGQRFTTIRVAEAAGVSVGSLYQYFPNKQSILYRLQLEEWARTGAMIDALLADASRPPARRLRETVRAFFRSECDEAPLRLALAAAAPAYRDDPHARTHRRRSRRIVRAFTAAAAPHATPRQRTFAGELLFATMSALGKHVSERPSSRRAVDAWADAVAVMLAAYFAQLAPRPRARTSVGTE
jgi:AcrR family transcriptional regulator